jgi:type IV pilus assembly protein PilV
MPKQAGMTLVEQLVTLVLVSVGLLGIAALQLASLRANREAYFHLQAGALANDILERIRANRQGFADSEYDAAFNDTGVRSTTAGNDLHAWQLEIDRSLPGGAASAAGAIGRTAGTNVVVVTIRWRAGAERNAADAAASIYRMTTEI